MNATQTLHILAHGLWLDDTTRLLLVGVTLTSNPTIFDHAIKSGTVYDEPIHLGLRQPKPDEDFGFWLKQQHADRDSRGCDPRCGFLNTPAMALDWSNPDE
jgi:hypothetical protein